MPCNAVATARAKVNMAALANVDRETLRSTLTEIVARKFPTEPDFYIQFVGNEVVVQSRRSRRMNEIAEYAQQVFRALAQRALAARIAKAARVTGQQATPTGAMILEVEL